MIRNTAAIDEERGDQLLISYLPLANKGLAWSKFWLKNKPLFDKINENIKDMVDVYIQDAKGVTLLGNRVLEKEPANEVN